MKSESLNLYNPKDFFIIENLKALAIIIVFIYHSPLWGLTFIFDRLALVLFAFSFGIYAKDVNFKFFSQKILGLLSLSFLIYLPNFLKSLYGQGLSNITLSSFFEIFFEVYLIFWYFLAMIIWAFISKIMSHKKSSVAISFIVSFIFLSIVPWFIESNQIKFTIFLFPFFLLGSVMGWKSIIELRHSKVRYLFIIPFLIFLLNILFYKIDLLKYFSEFGVLKYLLFWGSSFITNTIWLFFFLSFFIGKYIRRFTEIGTFSLSIYMFHIFFLRIMDNICIYFGTSKNILRSSPDFELSLSNPLFWIYGGLIIFCCLLLSNDFVHNIIAKLSNLMIVPWIALLNLVKKSFKLIS